MAAFKFNVPGPATVHAGSLALLTGTLSLNRAVLLVTPVIFLHSENACCEIGPLYTDKSGTVPAKIKLTST